MVVSIPDDYEIHILTAKGEINKPKTAKLHHHPDIRYKFNEPYFCLKGGLYTLLFSYDFINANLIKNSDTAYECSMCHTRKLGPYQVAAELDTYRMDDSSDTIQLENGFVLEDLHKICQRCTEHVTDGLEKSVENHSEKVASKML